jgi:hypothetical protein
MILFILFPVPDVIKPLELNKLSLLESHPSTSKLMLPQMDRNIKCHVISKKKSPMSLSNSSYVTIHYPQDRIQQMHRT